MISRLQNGTLKENENIRENERTIEDGYEMNKTNDYYTNIFEYNKINTPEFMRGIIEKLFFHEFKYLI